MHEPLSNPGWGLPDGESPPKPRSDQMSDSPKHEEVYDKCMKLAALNAGFGATPWIHLADAVEQDSISPMEAYDAMALGYLPEHLKVRRSRYSHLL